MHISVIRHGNIDQIVEINKKKFNNVVCRCVLSYILNWQKKINQC